MYPRPQTLQRGKAGPSLNISRWFSVRGLSSLGSSESLVMGWPGTMFSMIISKVTRDSSSSTCCFTTPAKAPFPYARFRWRVSAKEKVYFHARGNASAESRNSLGRRYSFSLSSQVQGRVHAHCVRMDNTRAEKSLIEQRFRAQVITRARKRNHGNGDT